MAYCKTNPRHDLAICGLEPINAKMQGMEINAYIGLVRRWLWFIALCVIIAGSAAFAIVRTQPALYQASTTIQVGSYSSLANPDAGMIATAAQLAQTYIALIKTHPVLETVVQKLQLELSPDTLAGLFQTRLLSGTSLLEIIVTHTDPVVANDIANELAAQLIANSPTELTQEQQEQLRILQDEIRAAQAQLQRARDELKVIDGALASDQDDPNLDRAVLIDRRAELIVEINAAQGNLASMSSTATQLQQQGSVNYLRVVEPSRIPDAPLSPPTLSRTLTAAGGGAVFALVVAFILEYLNNTLRSPAEVLPLLNVPLLGSIAPFGSKRSYKNRLIAWVQPRSSIAEGYRALRVNLLLRDQNGTADSPARCRIYAITSPGPSEGKSVTVANLAVTFAITGMRVLLIDTDLRRPTMHTLFSLPNATGLSSIWGTSNRNNKTLIVPRSAASRGYVNDEMMGRSIQLYLSHLAQKTEVPGLDVITAGPTPPNPAELLDTLEMRELVRQLVSSQRYDVIFFDTPPSLVVTDSSIVANASKASVILVVESGRTHRGSAQRAAQQLTALSIPVVGVVMNRLSPRNRDTEHGYYYYYGYSRYGEADPQIGPGEQGHSPGQNGNGHAG